MGGAKHVRGHGKWSGARLWPAYTVHVNRIDRIVLSGDVFKYIIVHQVLWEGNAFFGKTACFLLHCNSNTRYNPLKSSSFTRRETKNVKTNMFLFEKLENIFFVKTQVQHHEHRE